MITLVKISGVRAGSVAYSSGIRAGDWLVSINGHSIDDVLDYKFFSYDTKLELIIRSGDGADRTVKIKKTAGTDLGLEFESYLMDRAKSCRNRCVFCFVDQLPKGMRSTLYFKDDDSRLSFLTGNYITLTNLSERDLKRILELRISPLNISVHATEPSLRAKLMGNPDAASGYSLMQRLSRGGVTMNCQIVCCPGLNDGEHLTRSMEDLAILHPQVNSVSIVPVGLTKHREKRFPLTPFDSELAEETIDRIEAFSQKCLERFGSRIFFPADELFLKARREIPGDDYYEGYPQLENGVGMLRLLEEEFSFALENEVISCDGRQFSIATGVSAAPFLTKLLVTVREKYANINGRIFLICTKIVHI